MKAIAVIFGMSILVAAVNSAPTKSQDQEDNNSERVSGEGVKQINNSIVDEETQNSDGNKNNNNNNDDDSDNRATKSADVEHLSNSGNLDFIKDVNLDELKSVGSTQQPSRWRCVSIKSLLLL